MVPVLAPWTGPLQRWVADIVDIVQRAWPRIREKFALPHPGLPAGLIKDTTILADVLKLITSFYYFANQHGDKRRVEPDINRIVYEQDN